MAFLQINNVRISGVAAAVPTQVKDVTTLSCLRPEEVDNVVNVTGIKQSPIAPDGMVCSDYCQAAAEELIRKLGWEKESIDILIYTSVSRDYIEPNTATVIQGKMGLPRTCFTIDVPMACSGYCYALSVIGSLMQNGCLKRGLMLVGDTPSKIMSPQDKTLWPLHGDAGTATAIEFDESATPMFFNMMSDGSQKDAIIAPASGVREPITESSLRMQHIDDNIYRNRTHVAMDGMSVFSFTISQIPKAINNLIEKIGVDADDIDYLLLHQANKYIDEKIRQKLKFPPEKTPYCLEMYGNTSSATIPMTMVNSIAEQLSTKTNKLLMSGFGAGLSWGVVYMETSPFVVLPLIEI